MWEETNIDLGSGRSLNTATSGTGPDLVLIHGALTTSHDWRVSPVAAALARDWRVTILDRPGHGGSRRPRFGGTPRDQADQIAAGLDRLGVERPLVAAHSLGGLVALALAERQPERVASLLLLAPVAFPEPRPLEHSLLAPRSMPVLGPLLSRAARWSRLDRLLLEAVQRLMFSPQPVPPEWKESFPYDVVEDPDGLVCEGEDAASILPFSPAASIDLRRIATPVRIVTGTADRIVDPSRQARTLARVLPSARLAEIEGAGHMIHHTHTEAVLAAIGEAAPAAA
jgi:pimeloyl-ACP methyl ester carboxylesterase